MPIVKVKALYDYEPQHEDELGFKQGDVIDLIVRGGSKPGGEEDSSEDEGWSRGSINGIVFGVFPLNYVKQLEEDPLAKGSSSSYQARGEDDDVIDDDDDDGSEHEDNNSPKSVRYGKNTAERYKTRKL